MVGRWDRTSAVDSKAYLGVAAPGRGAGVEKHGPSGFLPAAVVYSAFLERTQARGGLGGFPNVCDIAYSGVSVPDLGRSENTDGISKPPGRWPAALAVRDGRVQRASGFSVILPPV
jgi:hypothetical protein